MLTNALESKFYSLTFNNAKRHSLRKIYTLLTGGELVTDENFAAWFEEKIREMNLVRDVHYLCRSNSINDVFIKGHVAMRMLMGTDNEIGRLARDYVNNLGAHAFADAP